MNETKEFLQEYFKEALSSTYWFLKKDTVYATKYYNLLNKINQVDCELLDNPEDFAEQTIKQIDDLAILYTERYKNKSCWETPKVYEANELVHKNEQLTRESLNLLSMAISDRDGEKCLISDTGKTISFGEKWHIMLNDCGFKNVAVNKLVDFISKFIAPNGWQEYFVGNIGKNNKRLIQEYHVMDKYNRKHKTDYAALHLGGDTTKCVLLSVDTKSEDGRSEPSKITFLEIGAHTIIDRYEVSSYNRKNNMLITEAVVEDLVELFELE